VAAVLAHFEAPILWHGLTGRALPISIGAIVLGLATAWALLSDAYLLARVLIAAETACILAAWGVAQWPYLIVPDVTIQNASSPVSVLGPTLIVSLVGLVILVPALWYLFYVFKRRVSTEGGATGRGMTTAAFVASLQQDDVPPLPPSTGADAPG
jgi:cytochrome d ubiquinol oxidase subunit II